MKYELREEYQVPCVNGVRNSYKRKKKAPLLVAPTGSGKTVIFSHIAETASTRDKRVMILAHRKELCTQCGEKMIANNVDFGYINPKYTPDYRKLVQVGTIQSVLSRMGRMWMYTPRSPKGGVKEVMIGGIRQMALDNRELYIPDLIIIDEAHRALAPTYINIINFYKERNPGLLILGVTASPVRGDGKSLSLLFDDIVLGPTVRKLIDLGYLVEPETYGSELSLDLSNIDIDENGDLNKAQLSKEVNTNGGKITGDAVKHYTKICPGVPAVAFCVDVQHAINVAANFRAAGYLFEHIDGEMKDGQRDDILRRLRNGKLHGITSVDLVTEGFDAPMLECAILLRPTLSLALAIQMPGRVLRPSKETGKKIAYILDHANVSSTLAQGDDLHGFIDDDRYWTLDGEVIKKKKKKKKDIEKDDKSRQCPQCFRMHKPALKCPNCGHVYKVQARDIDVVEGELVRLTRKKPELAVHEVSELQSIALDKGLPGDWAERIQREWEGRV